MVRQTPVSAHSSLEMVLEEEFGHTRQRLGVSNEVTTGCKLSFVEFL